MSRVPLTATAERFRSASGGRIDRDQQIRFTFDGRTLTGHPGDTLASALLANGVHLVGRSFKYHRPRGILAAGSEEPNALVTVRRDWRRVTPNLRATEVELYEGLAASSQNRWPSLGFDVGSLNDRLGPLFSAGFYYKTFMGPRAFGLGSNGAWSKLYEPVIRRMAGLGRAPIAADPDRYAGRYAHCDVLVVGAGPAGLAAALAAAEGGARVILADEQAEPGGALLAEPDATVDGQPAWAWLDGALAQIEGSGRVHLLRRTTVFGCYPDHMFGLIERLTDHLAEPGDETPRERLWQVRAREVVLAPGAIERPLVFPGNDRPGIMLAGAVRTYRNRFGVLAGTRAVLVATDDGAYQTVADLADDGIRIEGVVDFRREPGRDARGLLEASRIPLYAGATVRGTHGRWRVSAIDVVRSDGRKVRLDCDLVMMAGGWTPTLHLYSQLRGRLAWDAAGGTLGPVGRLSHVHLAGVVAPHDTSVGASTLAGAVADGRTAGEAAARGDGVGRAPATVAAVAAPTQAAALVSQPLAVAPSSRARPRAFVDFQNDVTDKDLKLAAQEGFRSIEHVKRYTTTGMATDQGKTSNINALGLVAAAVGRPASEVGHTTFRPPFTPVSFGALAGDARGRLFDPERMTPIDASARARGAIYESVGPWQRARYFPRAGEDMAAAVARECRTVRESVGVFDGSTLGKIEVVGPDAAAFLDRMYVNQLAGLGVGRCRYAIMLTEAGFVMDDGIVARLAPDRFHITTTTTGAARVLAHMEDYLQTEFPDLVCWLTSVTDQWGVIAVQGPRARDVLASLVEDRDLSSGALAHMGLLEGRILGVPMRLFRVSFTGEVGYEVNVPAGQARGVWDAIVRRAEAVGGTVYGTEAMHVLRAEKGYIIIGQDSDGTATPGDLGLPTGGRKPDFVGKRGLARSDLMRADRLELVGLEVTDGGGVLEEGAQLTDQAAAPPGTPAYGHVTSAYVSPTLGRPIALAMLKGGRARHGTAMFVPMPDGPRAVKVVAPVFYDVAGGRLHD